MSAPFSLLVVCTANLCRSPLAERLLQRALAARLGPDAARIAVSSAGTAARPGPGMHPLAADALTELGVPGGGFTRRRLSAEHLAAADLVLTAERRHRAQIVELHPAALARTVPLRQFDRLLPHATAALDPHPDPAVTARRLVAGLADARMAVGPGGPDGDDLVDPIGGPREAFDECALTLRGVAHRVAVALGAAPPPQPPRVPPAALLSGGPARHRRDP